MRISDWSSDVCSSDLGQAYPEFAAVSQPGARDRDRSTMHLHQLPDQGQADPEAAAGAFDRIFGLDEQAEDRARLVGPEAAAMVATGNFDVAPVAARKSVVEGRRGSVRVDLGGR